MNLIQYIRHKTTFTEDDQKEKTKGVMGMIGYEWR